MKLLTKVAIVAVVGGAGATMYASPHGGDSDLLARGVTIQISMKADLDAIKQLQAKAKRDHDVIKLSCVNDKLVIANPLMNLTDRLVTELDGSNGSASLASITGNQDQMHSLHEAAAACIDARALANETSNSFSHGDIPGIEGTTPGEYNGGGEIEPPGYASPDH